MKKEHLFGDDSGEKKRFHWENHRVNIGICKKLGTTFLRHNSKLILIFLLDVILYSYTISIESEKNGNW